jgi:2'-5' RNA ligase
VTIGRARAAISREDGYVDVEPLAFTIDTVTVYRSQLSPKGAVYEALERVALGAGR